MVKKIAALVLILAASGTWFYLDQMNKKEIAAAEELRQAMEAARAKAQALAATRAKFEAQITAELNACKAEAEKAKEAYLDSHKKPVTRKPGESTIPQAVLEEATMTLDAANAACQATYDGRLTSGQ